MIWELIPMCYNTLREEVENTYITKSTIYFDVRIRIRITIKNRKSLKQKSFGNSVK